MVNGVIRNVCCTECGRDFVACLTYLIPGVPHYLTREAFPDYCPECFDAVKNMIPDPVMKAAETKALIEYRARMHGLALRFSAAAG